MKSMEISKERYEELLRKETTLDLLDMQNIEVISRARYSELLRKETILEILLGLEDEGCVYLNAELCDALKKVLGIRNDSEEV